MKIPAPEPYTYVDYQCSFKSIIHPILQLGEELEGIELGTATGESFFTILHNCPNVKRLYGLDEFKPYVDLLTHDGSPCHLFDEKKIDMIKMNFYHNFKYSNVGDRGVFAEASADEALETFQDETLDFVLHDCGINYESAKNEIESWYRVLKPGGIYAGHDWNGHFIKKAVQEFREENGITSPMTTFDNVWMWYK